MIKGLYVLNGDALERIYHEPERERIAQLIDVYAPPQTAAGVQANPAILEDAEVILSGWGLPHMSGAVLAAARNLKCIFYGAGSIRYAIGDEFWDRGIRITSGHLAMAEAVADYTLGAILLGLKAVWQTAHASRRARGFVRLPAAGIYQSTVALISLGAVGRLVVERLRHFDLHVIAYDPFLTAEEGAALGIEMVSLSEAFARGDVVSLHTPWLPETEGLVTGALLGSMKPYATFINSARGAVVRESEMIDVLSARPDLWAVLDVTHPEPPVPDSPLYELPNVVLTPHIAGGSGREYRRLGRFMLSELERYLAGAPLENEITRERAAGMA